MKKLSHLHILRTKPSVEEVKKKKRNPISVVLDNIRSLYNVGAIFRTSDGILAEKLYLCGITGHPPRNEISKTALGAQDVVPWQYVASTAEVLKKLKKAAVQIVAVELAHKAVDFDKAKYKFPVCFVLGHEKEGIDDEVMKLVDLSIKIPMLGRANSLNVATCYGIIAYDALKKLP